MDWKHLDPVARSAVMTLSWRAAESRRPDRLFADVAAERAATLLAPWPGSVAEAAFADIVALRTVQLDRQVATAIAAGLDQIVVLGAGLDTRFSRVSAPASARIIEIDCREVNDLARRVLSDFGPRSRYDARIPGEVPRVLARAGYDRSRPGLWIAEGLLEYLPGLLWTRMLGVLTAHSVTGSRALITVLGAGLPAYFAHDATFPFARLPPLRNILASIPASWRVDVIDSLPMREVPVNAYTVLAMRRISSVPHPG